MSAFPVGTTGIGHVSGRPSSPHAFRVPDPTLQVRLRGCVTDTTGKPLNASVTLHYWENANFTTVGTDSSGCYRLIARGSPAYWVTSEVFPGSQQTGNESFSPGYIPQVRIFMATATDKVINFVMPDGGLIWLRSFDISGHEIYLQDLLSSYFWYTYPLNESLFTGESLQREYQTLPTYWGNANYLHKQPVVLAGPPDLPVSIWGLWRLPGIGTTFLHADNGSGGFTFVVRSVAAINIVYEFARTEYEQTYAEYQTHLAEKYKLSENIGGSLQAADQFLKEAETYHANSDEHHAALSAYKSLTNAVNAREEIQLEKARQDIVRYREFNYTFQILDSSGQPLSNANITYNQLSHDFPLSAGFPQNSYQDRAARDAGFNYASFCYLFCEPVSAQPGLYTFDHARNWIQSVKSQGLKPANLHSLWWTGSDSAAIFPYAAKYSATQLSLLASNFSTAIMTAFRGQVPLFEAYNEPDLNQVFNLTSTQMIDVIKSSVTGAEAAAPGVQTYVNIGSPIPNPGFVINPTVCDFFTGHCSQTYPSPFRTGYGAARDLVNGGVPFTTIGLESYYGVVNPPIDLGVFGQMLDQYAGLGKSVFLSELSYSTLDDYPGLTTFWTGFGGWHQGYTDEAQAAWASDAMTIAFSRPYITGVNWMVMDDKPPNGDFVGWGLLHSDETTPRPTLGAIRQLVANWTSTGTGMTDSAGIFSFKGFAGNYSLTVTPALRASSTFVVHLVSNITNPEFLKANNMVIKITSERRYSVEITESGLPAGEAWSASVGGQTYSSPLNKIRFYDLPEGASVWNSTAIVSGGKSIRYVANPSSGVIRIPAKASESVSFEKQYEVSFTANPSAGGSVLPSRSSWYKAGDVVGLIAKASSGYSFSHWSANDPSIKIADKYSTETSAQVNGPGIVIANFAIPTSTISTSSSTSRGSSLPEASPSLQWHLLAIGVLIVIVVVALSVVLRRKRS